MAKMRKIENIKYLQRFGTNGIIIHGLIRVQIATPSLGNNLVVFTTAEHVHTFGPAILFEGIYERHKNVKIHNKGMFIAIVVI